MKKTSVEEIAKQINDRYGISLSNPKTKPTLDQSVLSWWLINELITIGYPHNFQGERSDIRNYMYDVSSLIDKARKIAYLKNTVEPGMEDRK